MSSFGMAPSADVVPLPSEELNLTGASAALEPITAAVRVIDPLTR